MVRLTKKKAQVGGSIVGLLCSNSKFFSMRIRLVFAQTVTFDVCMVYYIGIKFHRINVSR